MRIAIMGRNVEQSVENGKLRYGILSTLREKCYPQPTLASTAAGANLNHHSDPGGERSGGVFAPSLHIIHALFGLVSEPGTP